MKTKHKKLSRLKSNCWDQFALYIKLKYSADGNLCHCYTCGKPIRIGTTDCQAGHCLPKKGYPGTYFHENNVRPQCHYCNHPRQGEQVRFKEYLEKDVEGYDFEEMKILGRKPLDWRRADYMYWIEYYTEKVKQLKKEKGL